MKCDSDADKTGRPCTKEAKFPLNAPTLCHLHYQYGERVCDEKSKRRADSPKPFERKK